MYRSYLTIAMVAHRIFQLKNISCVQSLNGSPFTFTYQQVCMQAFHICLWILPDIRFTVNETQQCTHKKYLRNVHQIDGEPLLMYKSQVTIWLQQCGTSQAGYKVSNYSVYFFVGGAVVLHSIVDCLLGTTVLATAALGVYNEWKV